MWRRLHLFKSSVEYSRNFIMKAGSNRDNSTSDQFGEQDDAPSPEQGQEQMDVASEPKQLHFYDAGHELNAEAKADRAAWLAEHKAALPLAELPLAEVDDDRLARVLGELGRAVEARARAARGAHGEQDQQKGGTAFS